MKKLPETDAIFANVVAARQRCAHDPEAVEVSMDTKAKVSEGDYSRGEKCRTDARGRTPAAWDHDPPARRQWTPWGMLALASGALTLGLRVVGGQQRLLGRRACELWWRSVKAARWGTSSGW